MGKAREIKYLVTLACFYLSRKRFCSVFFALERVNIVNFVTTSEARNISYYIYKSGFLEKLEIRNGNDVVSRNCISATISFAVTKFLLYTEYMLKTASFFRY